MGDEEGSPKKKVDTEALTNRLYTQALDKKKQWDDKRMKELAANETRLQTIGKDKKLDKEALDKMVESVYTQSMNKAKNKQEKNQRILEEQSKANSTKLNASDATEMIQRMYNQETEKRKTKTANLEKKYQPPPVHKKLDKESTAAVNARLFEDTKGKRDATREKLYEKYNGKDMPKTRRLGKDEQAAMAARLAEKK